MGMIILLSSSGEWSIIYSFKGECGGYDNQAQEEDKEEGGY